jgi:hypothetical protein
VVWTGKPVRYPVFDAGDFFLVPFSILWCGLAFRAAWPSDWVSPFVWSFVAIGLYLLVGRLVVRRFELRSTRYTVTNKRLVVESRVLGIARVRSEFLRLMPPPVAVDRGGHGDVRFGPLFKFGAVRGSRPLVLRGIEEPRVVRDLIMAQR